MGLHSSLKRAEKLTSTRSIMKRTERLKWLKEKGAWKEGDRVMGLPKIKVVKLKTVKKEKAKEEAPAEAGAAAPAPAAEAVAGAKSQAQQAKPAAAAKPAKPQAK
ncbi:MAG: small basic protein [Candidatus Omnitrophica bacterium]|nr:small basic protein [Candidatus Omnitrophota bacterium]